VGRRVDHAGRPGRCRVDHTVRSLDGSAFVDRWRGMAIATSGRMTVHRYCLFVSLSLMSFVGCEGAVSTSTRDRDGGRGVASPDAAVSDASPPGSSDGALDGPSDAAAPDASMPPSGDAGTSTASDAGPIGECTPGDTRGCGRCGTSTCGADGSWGGCGGEGGCRPGETERCGNCGTRTCRSDCSWGSCEGEGICAPGTSQSCGSCGRTTCASGCFFGPCECAAGAWRVCNETQTERPGYGSCPTSCSAGCVRVCRGTQQCTRPNSYSCEYESGCVGTACPPWRCR
jgi:hypothetical protein